MSTKAPEKQPTRDADVTRGILRRAAQLGIQFLIFAAILFLSSGRLDWWFAWVYLVIFVLGVGVNSYVLLRINPELIAERARQFVEGDIVFPFVFIGPARHRHRTVARSADGNATGCLVADVALHIGVDNILAGSVPITQCLAEFLPVAGLIQ